MISTSKHNQNNKNIFEINNDQKTLNASLLYFMFIKFLLTFLLFHTNLNLILCLNLMFQYYFVKMKIKGDYLLFVLLFIISFSQVQSISPVCEACHLIVSEV